MQRFITNIRRVNPAARYPSAGRVILTQVKRGARLKVVQISLSFSKRTSQSEDGWVV